MSLLQAWLRDMRTERSQQVPIIECANGLTMSVQASNMHYCTPRDNVGPWTHVEIGYPNKILSEISQYSDGDSFSIYGYVPIELVENIIEANGGMAQ